MAKKSERPADALLHIVSMLPWWAGVILAGLSFLVFHAIASSPATVDLVRGIPVGSSLVRLMMVSLAKVAQYVIPIICLAGAGVSAWHRRQRSALIGQVTQSQSAKVLDGISWREFEMLVGEAYRLRGFKVEETGGGGADGGVDLVLRKGSERTLVQCKQWKAQRVGVSVVRELFGVMAATGAAAGIVVTSGRFTDDAKDFASGRNVELVDGAKLVALIKSARESLRDRPSRSKGSREDVASTDQMTQALIVTPTAETASVSCPVCQSGMVRRKARRGSNAGEAFWGCTAYPGCKGTRSIA